jgi:glycosyltransferase involved in cell wall biosynthesis
MGNQIRRIKVALEVRGIQVEHLRWWDEAQTGEVIHFFGRMPTHLAELARSKGIKVVITEHVPIGTRAEASTHRWLMRLFARALPGEFLSAFRWRTYQLADACVAFTSWDANLMSSLFRAPAERVHVVAPGLEDAWFDVPDLARNGWLVCAGPITPETITLAEAAILARTPLWIIDPRENQSDASLSPLLSLAAAEPHLLQVLGPISDASTRARIYRSARGCVLHSSFNRFTSVPWEAAATGCPLLLSDVPWARAAFAAGASYSPRRATPASLASYLRAFYEQAPALPVPPRPLSSREMGDKLVGIYQKVFEKAADARVAVAV